MASIFFALRFGFVGPGQKLGSARQHVCMRVRAWKCTRCNAPICQWLIFGRATKSIGLKSRDIFHPTIPKSLSHIWWLCSCFCMCVSNTHHILCVSMFGCSLFGFIFYSSLTMFMLIRFFFCWFFLRSSSAFLRVEKEWQTVYIFIGKLGLMYASLICGKTRSTTKLYTKKMDWFHTRRIHCVYFIFSAACARVRTNATVRWCSVRYRRLEWLCRCK